MSSSSRPFFWPYDSHLLLLDAGLRSNGAAFESWKAWEERHNLDDIDQPSFRLLPLVTKNLIAQGQGEKLPVRLKGVYRYWWVQNQRLFNSLREVSQLFDEAGIRFIFLKGFPLGHEIYPDVACRAMGDGDILIQSADWNRAIEILENAKWTSYQPRFVWPRLHSIDFKLGNAGLDLHRYGLKVCESDRFTDELFARARPMHNAPFPALTLCDEDQLLIVCVNAAHAFPLESVHWVSDLYFLLNNAKKQGEAFDWSRLLNLAQRFQLHLMIVDVLEAFDKHFAEEKLVPEKVLDQLKAMKAPLVYHLENRWYATQRRGTRAQLVRYARFCRQQQNCVLSEKQNILDYWAKSWDLRHPRHIPTMLVRKTWRRILGQHKDVC